MTDSIPKSRSQIKPLKDKITVLEYENNQLLDECYENGSRKRPTIMTQIEDKEEETLRVIKYSIEQCEKITGRKFDLMMLCDHLI